MSPLIAIAIPAATTAAAQLVQQIAVQRPFALFFGRAGDVGQPGGSVSLDAIGSHMGQLLEKLQATIADRLAAAGIDPATRFDLSSDASGQLAVGEHPLRSQLEAALAGDTAIRDTFREIAAMRGLLDAAQRRLDFAQRYAVDPFSAQLGEPGPAKQFAMTFADGKWLLGQ